MRSQAGAWARAIAIAFTCCLLLGCGSGSDGPRRYELTGSVTFNGKPVPAGYILLRPDTARGADGPGGYADITDGKYRALDHGPIGGPHIAVVYAFDGVAINDGRVVNPLGTPLHPQVEFELDLPRSASTHDFALPRR